MTSKTVFTCEICGAESVSRERIQNCEFKGRPHPERIPVGLIFSRSIPSVHYLATTASHAKGHDHYVSAVTYYEESQWKKSVTDADNHPFFDVTDIRDCNLLDIKFWKAWALLKELKFENIKVRYMGRNLHIFEVMADLYFKYDGDEVTQHARQIVSTPLSIVVGFEAMFLDRFFDHVSDQVERARQPRNNSMSVLQGLDTDQRYLRKCFELLQDEAKELTGQCHWNAASAPLAT